ncbi:MAG: 50S ribosomal protein L23 [Anaerolineales bacterium]
MTIYDVLRRPIETEKSRHQNAKLHQYAFEVDARATKPQIKEAVETLFDVEVERVNVIVTPAKRSRRGRYGRRLVTRQKQSKKAIVTIRADQSIDLFEGVK